MNKFREKFLKLLSFFKLGGAITKFQTPAGPLEAQMRYATTTGRPVPTYQVTGDDIKLFYDLSHNGGSGLAYLIINGGLYLVAPFTGGATLPAAAVMSAGAIGSAGNDIADRGINLGNGIDIGFDVLNAAGGAGLALRYLGTASELGDAAVDAGRAYMNFDKAAVAYSAAEEAAEEAAARTAKLYGRRDALGAVMGNKATLNPKWRSLNKAASDAAKEAVYHSDGAAINTGVRSGVISGRAALSALVKLAEADAARRAAILASNRMADARYAVGKANEWRVMYAPWALGLNAANQRGLELLK